jgi:hypothetical protein
MDRPDVRDTVADLDLAAELLPLVVGLLILAIVVLIILL